jgi:hypothetical protein
MYFFRLQDTYFTEKSGLSMHSGRQVLYTLFPAVLMSRFSTKISFYCWHMLYLKAQNRVGYLFFTGIFSLTEPRICPLTKAQGLSGNQQVINNVTFLKRGNFHGLFAAVAGRCSFNFQIRCVQAGTSYR